MGNSLEAQTALQEAQWRVMKTWLETRVEKWDAYHQDDIPWSRGITDMVTRVVTATEGGPRVIKERKADTNGNGLEASIHADAMQTRRPEKTEEPIQSQTGRQLKANPKPKPKPSLTPTPRSTSLLIAVTTAVPTLARQWETVPQQK
jgi:hypothetical protein